MKNKSLILGVLLLFILNSCSDELGASESSVPAVPVVFGISDARHYFEENATDLALLRFTEQVRTKSSDLPAVELSPEWDQAIESANREASLVEVPLRSNAQVVSTIRNFKEGKNVISKSFPATIRLVVARRTNGRTDMFVITLIPSLNHDRNLHESMANFRYLGGGDLTGKVFCSTLEGQLVEACQYVNGPVC